ncbi:MAG: amidohydrolase family protein [Planctomycetes bacterium]|nr:amidohydrolase family protein [Planctomycetota bacterium]
MPIRRIVDSHVHLIDTTRMSYPWMDQAPEFRRPFTPAHYREATVGLPITDLVFMEVTAAWEHCVDEIDWVESLRADEPRLGAMVARAPLSDARRREQILGELRTRPRVTGIRDIIQSEPRGYCCSPGYIAGVQLAARLGFAIELCVFHPQLPDVIELVRSCPEARFMLDHCGKPGIRDGLLEPWRTHIRELAGMGNVSCKISALLTEADLKQWRREDFTPYTDHVLACFGPKRVLYGGDWPILTLAGTYRDWFAVTGHITSGWSESDLDAFYYANAREFYRIA